MQDSDGFHAAPVLRDRADADERTGDVVDADGGAALAARGCPDLDRLAVPERDGRALVEGHPLPARQRRFRRRDARPEHCRLGADDVGPGDRVGEVEGADTTPDEALDGAAVAERGPQVGGEHPHVSALAADDTEGGPRRGDLVDGDRMDDDFPRLAVDLDPLARQLVEAPPLVVDRRVHGRDLLDPTDERPARRPRAGAARGAGAAASTPRVASASGFASVHPAAFGWPPPPNCAAIRCTSTSPLPRRLTFTWPRYSRKRHATRTVATERG